MEPYQYVYDFPLPLPGNRDAVFEALCDPRALRRWFAEFVDIDPREGGAYRFWGRHTLGTPGEDEADQRITRFEPGVALAFTWPFLGRESTVIFNLRDEDSENPARVGAATRLLVEHHFEALPDIERAAELVDDLWRVHTGSLLEYLTGNPTIYRPDFLDPNPTVRCEIEINAPPATVFRVLTEPEFIGKWFPAPAPVVDPHVGGRYGFGFSFERDGQKIEPPPSKILEFEQDRKLSITWPDWRGDPSVADQTVTWELIDLGGGRTRLVLLHRGFERPSDVADYPIGWQHYLRLIDQVAGSLQG